MRKAHVNHCVQKCLLAAWLLTATSLHAQNSYVYGKPGTSKSNRTVKYNEDTNIEKQTLFNVLKDLNKSKGIYFLFSEQSLGDRMVNVVTDKTPAIETILDAVLKNTGLKYKKVNDKTFVILPEKDRSKAGTEYNPVNFTTEEPSQENKPVSTVDPITGKVTGPDGAPLSNVSITVKGTSRGTSTNTNGAFTIEANKGETLVFSFVGYGVKEVRVGGSNEINVSLAVSDNQLNEVVVTALGIRKERKAVGYSVTEIKGEELTKAREVNVLNSLVGKVAGLNVNSIAGGPGSSSNVIIRGISSLTQTNQPLYVINGVPIENKPNGNPGDQYDNAPDLGDAIGNLNPDDIETISVLKGAAASALYGYRAKAGVILITTKSGKGNGIEFNSNYVAEQVMDPTDWQYVYGQGSNNLKPTTGDAASSAGQSSWGAKLDGSNVVQFDGVSRPYIAQKDNVKNFYRTGGTFTNTIALNKSFEGGSIRFSASDLHNRSVVPNSGLKRQSFNFSGNFTLIKRLTIDARANYILEQATNRPFLSDGAGNANFNVMFLPTSLDVRTLKQTSNPDGSEFAYAYKANVYATNPWFAAEKFINNTKRERLISSVTLKYTLDNGLFIQGRVGRDSYTDEYLNVVPTGTAYRPNGSIQVQNTKLADLNVDGLIGKTFKVNQDFTITPNIGASYRRTKSESLLNSGSNFAVPFVYNISNATSKAVSFPKGYPDDQEVQSIYGTLELAYQGYLYLNGSLRNDWFSTLATPGVDNKLNILYPSVSGSFIFSQLWNPGSSLSFGKLRAGYAVVGQGAPAYQTQLSYNLNSATLNGRPLGSVLNTSVPNSSLKPSNAKEIEVGVELKFLHNRLGLDLTWYNKKSTNEIILAPASITSGYEGATLNIGEMRNKGVEVLVTGTPVQMKDFTWTTSVNGSVNDNKVVSLAEGQASLAVGTSRSGKGFTRNVVDYAAAQVMAFDYKYDAAGKVMYDANGVPLAGDLVPWGSAYHKWIAGWNNEFTYKKFNLSFLIDGKWGGKIFSATDYYGYIFGLHKATLVNRESSFGTLDAATYYSQTANNVSKLFVQDASFIKFRQLMLGYTFPSKAFGNVVKSATLSLVARNLFVIMKHTDNIDPESNYTAAAQGLELGGVPPVRTLGVNLNVKF